MEEKNTIGVLTGTRKSRELILSTLHECIEVQNNLIAFTPRDINWKMKTVSGLIHRNGQLLNSTVAIPKVIYNRCYNSRTSSINQIEEIIGKNRVFNRINRLDKWKVYNIFQGTLVKNYLPYTSEFNEICLNNWIGEKVLFYLKPCLGHKGDGVFRCEIIDGEIHVSEHSLAPRYIWSLKDKKLYQKIRKLCKGKQYLIQEGIMFAQFAEKYFDLRVLVQKDSRGNWGVTNIVSRVANKDYFNTSINEIIHPAEHLLKNLFSEDDTNKLLLSLRYASMNAAVLLEKELGLMGELGVDFAIDRHGKVWIIEINGKPNKRIYRTLYTSIEEYRKVYRKPLEFAHYLFTSIDS